MKIGIVGPAKIVDKVNSVAKLSFPQITPINLIYHVFREAPALVKHHQPHLDALLFAGPTPFSFAREYVNSSIYWDYLPRSGTSLLRALLEAVLIKKTDICNVSFDSYDVDTLYEVYDEIGISKDNLNFHFAERTIFDPNYIQHLCYFHKEKYNQKNVSCCVTAIVNVYEDLKNSNIPCVMIDSTANVIRETLRKMYLNHLIQVNQENQIVALSIKIDDFHAESLLNENEYQFIVNKLNIAKQIYTFAQRIQAAVTEVNSHEYLLFSTKYILENQTNNLENIDLMKIVHDNTSSTISMGVGYGKTALEAKLNSKSAMERANKLGGNMAFASYTEKDVVGPIGNCEYEPKQTHVDEKFLHISEKTGLGMNTAYRLYSIIEQCGKNSFTPKELSELFGVTPRTMNRIIEKLDLGGFCTIIGKKTLSASGRPSRIIQLKLL